jgi:hypothetical protein
MVTKVQESRKTSPNNKNGEEEKSTRKLLPVMDSALSRVNKTYT